MRAVRALRQLATTRAATRPPLLWTAGTDRAPRIKWLCTDSNHDGDGAAKWSEAVSVYSEIARDDNASRNHRSKLLQRWFTRSLLQSSNDDFVSCLTLTLGHQSGPSAIRVGDHMLRSALATMLCFSPQDLADAERLSGDLAEAATEQYEQCQSVAWAASELLTVQAITNGMRLLSTTHGEKSGVEKEGVIQSLVCQCSTREELLYLIRLLQGPAKMRIGIGELSIIGAAASAALCNLEESDRAILGQAERVGKSMYMARYSIPEFAASLHHAARLFHAGSHDEAWETCAVSARPEVMVPARPMLASSGNSVEDVLEKMERYHRRTSGDVALALQYKYDGERALVHVHKEPGASGHKVRVFSRNGEDVTERYRAAAEQVAAASSCQKSIILDGEMVAVDRERQVLRSFQNLTRRRRKLDSSGAAEEGQGEVQVCFFAFDVLEIDGTALTEYPLPERRRFLEASICRLPWHVDLVKSVDMTVPGPTAFVDSTLRDAVNIGCEGLVVKSLHPETSAYDCGIRTSSWIKLKKEYVGSSVADTFDLVPVGAYFGKGRRKGVYGSFLMACIISDDTCRLSSDIAFGTICKVGTGFSDEQLEQLHTLLAPTVLDEGDEVGSRIDIPKSLKPDVEFAPSMVWEVKAADISVSPVHTAASKQRDESGTPVEGNNEVRGLALRFPRFVRVREDKPIAEVLTADMLEGMWQAQADLIQPYEGSSPT